MESVHLKSLCFQERPKAAFLTRNDCPFLPQIFDNSIKKRIAQSADLLPIILTPANYDQYKVQAQEVEILFTCWGMPVECVLNPEQFPKLRILFFSGGSTKAFSRPLLKRGVQVVSARTANAISVAHFCLGQILLSCKGYFQNTEHCRRHTTTRSDIAFVGAGVYDETIALIGMGAVGQELALLLQHFPVRILAVDPYLTEDDANIFRVKLVTLEEAFAQAYVVSNHLPDLPNLQGILNRRLFSSMRPSATFINTGRGAQVNETDLIEVFKQRTDLTALLDVTMPEPPVPESPLYRLPNIQLSSHIAGAMHKELRRLGDFIIDELTQYVQGKPLIHADSLESLDRLA